LGAAIDLMGACLKQSQHKRIQERLQQLRCRLGPLRDVDVMLAALEPYRLGHTAPVRWIQKELRERRWKARRKLRADRSSTAIKQLNREIVKKLEAAQPQFRVSLGQMIRHRFKDFSRSADALAAGQIKIDVHSVRLSAKKVRYSLEIAAALGAALPERIGQQFKQIQDVLGSWHDRVVLAQRSLKFATKRGLAMENPALLRGLFKLIDAVTADAAGEIEACIVSWKSVRAKMSAAVRHLSSDTLGRRSE
jgi:CHAD domain-containing protein